MWNGILLVLSYYHTVFYKTIWQQGLPFAVSVEPTNRCNLRCPQCPTGAGLLRREKGTLSAADFNKTLDHLPREVFYLMLYFQGEPFLNDDLLSMIRRAKQQHCYVVVATNGNLIDEKLAAGIVESGLDEIIIALDGATSETYRTYRRGGDFELVMEGIKLLIKKREELGMKKPFVRMQTLLLRSTEAELSAIRELGRSLGVDRMQTKTAQFFRLEPMEDDLPVQESLRRYEKNSNGSWVLKNKLKNRCFRMWSRCVITWQGQVVPCCYDKDAEYVMGRITEKPLKAIWKDHPYRDFRRRLLRSRKSMEICSQCAEGMRGTIQS